MVHRFFQLATAVYFVSGLVALPAFGVDAPVEPAVDATNTGLAAQARAEDAAIDRGILGQPADTLGAGKVSINSCALFLSGVRYGITDNIAVSTTALLLVTAGFSATASASTAAPSLATSRSSVQSARNSATPGSFWASRT